MKKRSIVMVLCLVMVLMPGLCTAQDEEGGVSSYKGASSWAEPELRKAAEYGLITDRIKDNMSGNINREEFAEIAVKLYELYTGKKAAAGSVGFTDTANPEILKAANMGMVQGVGGGKFAPGQLVTREQMATILLRTLKVLNPAADFSVTGISQFADDKKISSWARDGVYYIAKAGVIKGVGGNLFNPKGYSSREVAVIACTRAYALYMQAGNAQNSGAAIGEAHTNAGFSNEILIQSIEKLDSYRRIIRTVVAATATTKKWESIKEFAYIRNPISRYMKLDFPDSGSSFTEEIIIGSKMWSRMTKDEAWTEWNEWYYDPPVSFKYDISTQPYPIDYGKLTYTNAGSEKVNGVNCIKYIVSGSYKDEFTFENSPEKFPITLSASGTIWIADDLAIKTAIIRQRITVITDITAGKDSVAHSEEAIEDDVMDVNSTVISLPTNVIKGN